MKNLLITHCALLGASETFIRTHIEHLPFYTTFVHDLPPKRVSLENYAPGEGKVANALEDHTEAYLEIFSEVQPDVVLAEYGPSGVAVLEACKQSSVPLVVHFHGFDASIEVVLKNYKDAYLRLFDCASAIIGVSNAMLTKLRELGASREKLALIPYGVDLDAFTPSPLPETPIFLFLGRLVEKKDPLLAIRAFHAALQKQSDIRLIIAGSGPMEDQCTSLIAELGLSQQVEMQGFVHHDQVPALLASISALILPSKKAQNGDEEGLPNCILEAMAAGRPVIATHHAGIPDAVVSDENGILIEEGDEPALVRAMIRLSSNSDIAQSFGMRGRARAEATFSGLQAIASLARTIEEATIRVNT